MKPVDCHCHLDFDRYDADREEVIEKCSGRLEFMVNAGRGAESNRESLKLEKDHEKVVANLGIHPTNTEGFSRVDKVKGQIRENDPFAVGEIGLDHHHIESEEMRDRQEKVFREMLELAEELGKPVVVHSRAAERKAFEILKDFSVDVMLHCFNGSLDLAEEAVDEGMMIGVTTQVCYSGRVQSIAENIDLDHVLLETDSPFLWRGGRNRPSNVVESAEEIAGIKEVKFAEVVEPTTGNARRFFGKD
jgi:TatD DNase family protein